MDSVNLTHITSKWPQKVYIALQIWK